jgi:IS30 family transposase
MTCEHLSRSERVVIANMREQGKSRREVARALGRSPSTISRELRRNWQRRGPYDPFLANWQATERRRWCRPKPKRCNTALMRYVEERLRQAWSPEQIAGRLRHHEARRTPKRWISYETIYRHVRADRRAGGTLYRCLRHGKRKYNKRYAYCPTRGRIKDRVGIEHRPKLVERQKRCGDWEGDTMTGRASRAHLVTLVERKTLYLRAHWVPDLKTRSVNDAILGLLREPGTPPVRTLTFDNGTEFSSFKELEGGLHCRVYFTRPYRAWERPINENTNGLLRQFMPKRTDFATLTQDVVLGHVHQLNHRPRKKLNYRTPQEAVQRYRVALQG